MSFALSSFSVVGFSGSRRGCSAAALSAAFSRVASGASVFVGCASGVDAVVRCRFGSRCRVFSASSRSRGGLAARSAGLVRAVAAAGGCWVSFPSCACPAGLVPSPVSGRCFCGFGSGSWASLAFAVGLGVPCLVFSPWGVPAGWGFSALGRGWFVRVP
ncbi:MAG: hypothetical protein KME16_28020 [Scytolyngbya sp. HA4215-MV1]|nr:hypothetical protein [Scytolyngbya sp. HA4215-MV1]